MVGDVAHFFLYATPLQHEQYRRAMFGDVSAVPPPLLMAPSFLNDFKLSAPAFRSLREPMSLVLNEILVTNKDVLANEWCSKLDPPIRDLDEPPMFTIANMSAGLVSITVNSGQPFNVFLRILLPFDSFENLTPLDGFGNFLGLRYNRHDSTQPSKSGIFFCGTTAKKFDFTDSGEDSAMFGTHTYHNFFRLRKSDCVSGSGANAGMLVCRVMIQIIPVDASYKFEVQLFKMQNGWLSTVFAGELQDHSVDYEAYMRTPVPNLPCFVPQTTSEVQLSVSTMPSARPINSSPTTNVNSMESTSSVVRQTTSDSFLGGSDVTQTKTDNSKETETNNTPDGDVFEQTTEGIRDPQLSIALVLFFVLLGVVLLLGTIIGAVYFFKNKEKEGKNNSTGAGVTNGGEESNYGNLSSFSKLD